MRRQPLARRQADHDGPVIAEPDRRRRERVSERVGDELDRAGAPHADQAVGHSEINADDHGAGSGFAELPATPGTERPGAIATTQSRLMPTRTDMTRFLRGYRFHSCGESGGAGLPAAPRSPGLPCFGPLPSPVRPPPAGPIRT